jgi:uncharacterized protein YbaR (Trm112 family)
MKASLLRLIRCPDCAAALSLLHAREQNAEIVSGILQCPGCRASFPIEDGLPVILRSDTLSERTRASFGKQWKLHEQRLFEQETIYGKSRQEGLLDFQRAFGLADLASLQDCMILDAGCGSGVLTADIGRAVPAATVVGVDFSASARLAFERCRELPNVHIIQADLSRPPLAPRIVRFDLERRRDSSHAGRAAKFFQFGSPRQGRRQVIHLDLFERSHLSLPVSQKALAQIVSASTARALCFSLDACFAFTCRE